MHLNEEINWGPAWVDLDGEFEGARLSFSTRHPRGPGNGNGIAADLLTWRNNARLERPMLVRPRKRMRRALEIPQRRRTRAEPSLITNLNHRRKRQKKR